MKTSDLQNAKVKLTDVAFEGNHLWYKLASDEVKTRWLCMTVFYAHLDLISSGKYTDFRCLHPKSNESSMHDFYACDGRFDEAGHRFTVNDLTLPTAEELSLVCDQLQQSLFNGYAVVTDKTVYNDNDFQNTFICQTEDDCQLPVILFPVYEVPNTGNDAYAFGKANDSKQYLECIVKKHGDFWPGTRTTILCQDVTVKLMFSAGVSDRKFKAVFNQGMQSIFRVLQLNALNSKRPRFIHFFITDFSVQTKTSVVAKFCIVFERRDYMEGLDWASSTALATMKFIQNCKNAMYTISDVAYTDTFVIKPPCSAAPTKTPIDEALILAAEQPKKLEV